MNGSLLSSALVVALLVGCGVVNGADANEVRVCSDIQQISDANTIHVDSEVVKTMRDIALTDARKVSDPKFREAAVALWSGTSTGDSFAVLLDRCKSIGHAYEPPATTSTSTPCRYNAASNYDC